MEMEREQWNMKGNTRKFLSAEKAYKEAYRSLVGPMPIYPNENEREYYPYGFPKRIVNYLSQSIANEGVYNDFISKARALMKIIGEIVPQNTKLKFVISVLFKLSNTQPNYQILSCICFHSALNNLCEFVHLHRSSERFRTGYMLFSKANSYLGLGFVHYAAVANNLIRLATTNWTEEAIKKTIKLIGRNIYIPNPVFYHRVYLEEALPLAEVAYRDSPNGHQLSPVNITLSNGFTFNGRFHLPLSLSGYVAEANCTDRTIVGFRGTEKWVNWITDITQYLVGSSLVYKMALGLLIEIYAQKGEKLLVVGHSLGGGLTQYSVAGLDKEGVVGMCYNSAGLSDLARFELRDTRCGYIYHLHLKCDQIFLIGNQLGSYSDMHGMVRNPITAHYLSSMRRYVSIGKIPHCRIN